MVRAALVGYGNDAGVRSVVIQIGTGVICLKGVILGLVRQGSSILAVLFGYLDVVVTGDSELALGRDTGNRQLNRAAAGKRIRSCGDLDRGCSLIDSQSKLVRRSAIICATSKTYRNFRGACTDDSNRHGAFVILNSSNGSVGACHSGCFICCIGKGKRLIAIGSGGLVVGNRDAARLTCYGDRDDRSGCNSGIRTILNRYNAVIISRTSGDDARGIPCICSVGNLGTVRTAAAGVAVPLIRIVKAVNRLRHLGGQGNRTTADVGISGRRGHGDSGGSQRPAIGICINIFCGGGALAHGDCFPFVKRISRSLGRDCLASIIQNGICRGQNIIGVGGIAPTGNIVSPFKIALYAICLIYCTEIILYLVGVPNTSVCKI